MNIHFTNSSFVPHGIINKLFQMTIFAHFLLQTVLITSNGAWKLGGFGFAITTDQASSDSANVQSFHYAVS